MGNIIKLDPLLINQISAGEVVERPASVIKELVENSIDAEASSIKIEIQEGGKKEMIVWDNGKGINKEDLEICLEKYTTSKITSLADLYNVLTFGFRGEALASISSVSEMSIISKTKNSLVGYQLDSSQEKGQIITQSSHSDGTRISVKNLFYNTPARLNYLKQDRTEYGKILSYLENAVLSYPEIGFEFICDNKKIFKYNPGETLKTRIYHIYGEEFSQNILDIHFEMVGIHVTGYISDPKVSFQNKNKQHIFVNKRPISSIIISKAISDAYNRFIPHGLFPGYVINIQVDPTLVDVNVHPRKTEIRFENEQNIFRSVYHAVLHTLEKTSLISPQNPDTEDSLPNQSNKPTFFESTSSFSSAPRYFTGSGNNLKDFSPYKNTQSHPNQYKISDALDFTKKILENDIPSPPENIFERGDLHYTKLGKIIGQSFNSYILVENEGKIIILDQHALAERVIYEKLIQKDTQSHIQKLLIPESIKLTSLEAQVLEENKSIFSDMGFEIESLSNGIISVYAIPDFVKKEKLNEIILGVIEDIHTGNSLTSKTLEEVKNKIYAYTACRSAIKFGNKLNLFEMNQLLNESLESYSSTCPHGRPVIFEISLQDLKDKYER